MVWITARGSPCSKPRVCVNRSRLYWWDEVPQVLQFNPYVKSGYRAGRQLAKLRTLLMPLQLPTCDERLAGLSCQQCMGSLFHYHNETGVPHSGCRALVEFACASYYVDVIEFWIPVLQLYRVCLMLMFSRGIQQHGPYLPRSSHCLSKSSVCFLPKLKKKKVDPAYQASLCTSVICTHAQPRNWFPDWYRLLALMLGCLAV